jgi:ribosomal protein S18 acetylase RimI-like enzyme
MATTTNFRTMTLRDIDFGMRLKSIAGWNQLPADWKRLIDLEPTGCFILESGGEPVGTVTTTNYERRLAWIGMVLVSPEHRRKGFGTQLLLAAMDYCKSQGIEVIKLDATPLGKKLYDTLGYHDEYSLKRMQGWGSRQSYQSVRPMRRVDLWEVVQMDITYFGISRQRLLEKLFEENSSLCFVAQLPNSPEIIGYLFARPGETAYQIGPWISKDRSAAEELFKAGLNATATQPVFIDVLRTVNPFSEAMVERYGFGLQREFIRMFCGENLFPGRPSEVYAISGVEKG